MTGVGAEGVEEEVLEFEPEGDWSQAGSARRMRQRRSRRGMAGPPATGYRGRLGVQGDGGRSRPHPASKTRPPSPAGSGRGS